MDVIFKVTFSYLYVITFLSNFRFQEQLRTLAICLDVIDMAFKLARAWWCYQSQPVYLGLINITRFFRNCYFGYGANHTYCEFVGPFIQSALRPFYLGCGSNRFCLDNSLGCEVISYLMSRYFTSLSDFWKIQKSPTCFHWSYSPAPHVLSRVVHVILLPCALVLVLRSEADIKFTNKVQAINKTESIFSMKWLWHSEESNMENIFRVSQLV